MPITSLTIRNVASYDAVGVTLSNLKKLNFFFGYNGTGKSTIVRCIRNMSLPIAEQLPEYKDCSINGYNSAQELVLVYDEQFRKNNFIDSDKIKGVFSLNQQNAAIDAKIALLETKIAQLTQDNLAIQLRKKDCEEKISAIRHQLVEVCFADRNQFKGFVKATLQYGRNKEQHFEHIKEILKSSPITTTFTDIANDYNKFYEQEIKIINLNIEERLCNDFIFAKQNLNNWLEKIIVGKDSVDIADLIKKLNMTSWVNEGRIYLDKVNEKCPFCQQPLVDKNELRMKLNSFFDDNFQASIQAIKDAGNTYHIAYEVLKKRLIQLKEHAPLVAKLCDDLLVQINNIYQKNLDVVRQKIAQPNEIKPIIACCDIDKKIQIINQQIEKNNTDAQNIETLKQEWIVKCWSLMALDLKENVLRYQRKEKYVEQKLKPIYELHSQIIESKLAYYKQQIELLRQQTINTKEAVDNINNILSSVGFTDFTIEEIPSSTVSTQYRLKRISSTSSTNVYHSLSEGEKTFISFLYFYQLCIGTDNMSNSTLKKIVIIDDPISSLDSQILFIVSSIIHKLDIQDITNKHTFKDTGISQIILLTHNLYFYKEISFDRRPFCKDVMHYRVYKPGGFSKIEYSNKAYPTDDYSLLWKSVKESKDVIGIDENRNIMVCNVMRRIIDSYVNFIGLLQGAGNPTWSAINSLPTTDPRYIVASSFISQINDESHGITPFDSTYYGKVIRQDTSTLYAAFKLIFDEIGQDHYNMMMR